MNHKHPYVCIAKYRTNEKYYYLHVFPYNIHMKNIHFSCSLIMEKLFYIDVFTLSVIM